MRLFGLIGYPLSHSFSKNYFTQKFERERRVDCRYELFPIANIQKLPELLELHPDLEGLNVTIPYKQDVLPYLHKTEGLPKTLQACNCIRIRYGVLEGFNTDFIGFENSLKPMLQPHHRKALVLGNGGASKAVMYVLQKLNIPFEVVSRKLHEGSTLTYEQLDFATVRSHTLIINTTPLGTFPNVNECPPIPYEGVTNQHLLYDLVYNPELTLFMERGQKQGAAVKNGYEMLVGQAEAAWRIWNEGRP
jgi:shikimate dehydrogenase